MSKHPVFFPPDDPNIKIWRYMDFTKFISMLEHKGLFFPRADQLGDPFEGSISKANLTWRASIYKGEIPQEAFYQLDNEIKNSLTCTWVSCWHMNEHESAAMWKLYANANQDEAIAIQSTYARLDQVLSDYENTYIGSVHYIDYEKNWMPEGNMLYPITHKRKSFEHERELRAVIYDMHKMESEEPMPLVSIEHPVFHIDAQTGEVKAITSIYDLPDPEGWLAIRNAPPPPPRGEWRTVDLGFLIEAVYLAPTARTWFKELIEQVCTRYKLQKPIIQSSLSALPVY